MAAAAVVAGRAQRQDRSFEDPAGIRPVAAAIVVAGRMSELGVGHSEGKQG